VNPGAEAGPLPGVEDRVAATPDVLSFTIYGLPATKGSTRAYAVRRGGVPTGAAVVVPDNKAALRDWTRAVSDEVARIAGGTDSTMFSGPVRVALMFHLPRPKSEPKTKRTWPDRKPDVDKLARAVLDPMRGAIYTDDAKVVGLLVEKDYAEVSGDHRPRCHVWVWSARGPQP
jgi:Holliday junction resolvase RusA-like endonuclease